MAELFANNATTTLNGAINSSTTSVVVTSGSAFPATGNFRIRIDDEIMIATARSSNTLTVTRGAESTTAASHSSGASVRHVVTAGSLGTFVQGTTPSGAVVGTTDAQSLSGKTLVGVEINGAVTGTYTLGGTPTFPSSVVQLTALQTLTNKTLTNPAISQISNTGTLTLPTSTDTLVGRATTDTLTNKTILVSQNTITTSPNGNLTSTNLNGALAELQTDIDTRPQYSTGTLASIPTSSVRTNDRYEPTDGLFSEYRYSGTQWLPVYQHGRATDALLALSAPYYNWYLTGSGTNEYACVLASNGTSPSLTQPATLFINGAEATAGTAGSLSAGQWGWGNYSGFNTVHVRLSDGTDPDTKAYGYIRSDSLSWLVKGNMSATVTKNHLYISSASNGATLTCRMRAMNVPSTPYTAYAFIRPGAAEFANINHFGVGWSDGTKFSSIALRFYNRSLYVTHMSDSTTFSADSGTLTVDPDRGQWLAVRDDGTNRIFYVGSIPDYTVMNTVYSISRTNFLTPTKVGIIDIRNSTTSGAWFPSFHIGA